MLPKFTTVNKSFKSLFFQITFFSYFQVISFISEESCGSSEHISSAKRTLYKCLRLCALTRLPFYRGRWEVMWIGHRGEIRKLTFRALGPSSEQFVSTKGWRSRRQLSNLFRILSAFNKHDKTQLLAKFKKILYMGFRATLNFWKFKVALKHMYRILLNFPKSCIVSCLSKFDIKKKFHRAVFEI